MKRRKWWIAAIAVCLCALGWFSWTVRRNSNLWGLPHVVDHLDGGPKGGSTIYSFFDNPNKVELLIPGRLVPGSFLGASPSDSDSVIDHAAAYSLEDDGKAEFIAFKKPLL